jgi:uncharacterized protein involved in outer membrane biogenesis
LQPNNNNPDGTANTVSGKIRPGRIALLIAATIILVIGATITWFINDTDRIRRLAEGLVTNLTDRPFHIRGDFDFHLGSDITIYATDVEWINAPWSSQSTMLSVSRAEASVNVRSLIFPPIIISNAMASDARLDFEWDQDGVSNWLLVDPNRPPREEPLHPLPLLLDKADLKNVEIHFKHPGLTNELIVLVNNATQQQDESNRLVLSIDSTVEDRNFTIDGRIGPFPELVIAGAVDFDLAAVGPNAILNAAGSVGNLAGLKDLSLDADFSAPEIAAVLDTLNLPEVTRGKAALSGKLTTGEDTAAGELTGSVGEFDVDGQFQVASLQNLDGITAKLLSQGPSANAAFNIVGLTGMPREPYRIEIDLEDKDAGLRIDSLAFESAGATVTGSGLIKDFPALRNMDLEVEIQAEDIARYKDLLPTKTVPNVPLNLNARIESNVEDSKDKVVAEARLGRLTAGTTGILTEETGFAGSTFDFTLAIPDATDAAGLLGVTLSRPENIEASGTAAIQTDAIKLDIQRGLIGTHNFTAQGQIPLGDGQQGIDFATTAQGKSLANLVQLFASSERIPAMPYDLRGNVSLAGNKLALRPLGGRIGTNNIRVSGDLRLGQATPDLDLSIDLDGTDLGAVLLTQGIEGGPAEQYSLSTLVKYSNETVSLSGIEFKTSDDFLGGALKIGNPDGALLVDFDLEASGDDLQSLAPEISFYKPAAAPFEIRAKGQLNKKKVDISELKANIGAAKVLLGGELTFPPELKANNVKFAASGPSLRDLGTIAGWEFRSLPFKVSATMQGSNNALSISDFTATADRSDLRGRFNLVTGEKPAIDLQLDSRLLDFRDLEARIEDIETAAGEAKPEAKEKAREEKGKDSRLIPDQVIPVEWLNALDANVKLDIGEFVTKRLDLGTVNVEAKLRDGTLDIERFAANTKKGRLRGTVRIDQAEVIPAVEANATAKNLVIALGELNETLRETNPGQNIDLHLRGKGKTYRDLAASLNGYIWLRGDKRKIDKSQIDFLFGDFLTEVFTTLNPFAKKDPSQTLECNALLFEVTDGLVQTAPAILLRTDKLNMAAVGGVNLANEKIDFGIEATPRSGIGLSAGDLVNPFVKITGTLAKPGLGIDPQGTLIEGGAAVATMGLTIVAKSMYKRWLSPKQTCQTLTEEARKIRLARDPEHVPLD